MFANGPDTNPLNDCPNSTVMDLAYDFDSQLVMGDSPNSLLMSESTDSTIMDVTPVPRVVRGHPRSNRGVPLFRYSPSL